MYLHMQAHIHMHTHLYLYNTLHDDTAVYFSVTHNT